MGSKKDRDIEDRKGFIKIVFFQAPVFDWSFCFGFFDHRFGIALSIRIFHPGNRGYCSRRRGGRLYICPV